MSAFHTMEDQLQTHRNGLKQLLKPTGDAPTDVLGLAGQRLGSLACVV